MIEILIPTDVESRLKELASAAGFGDDVQRYMLHCSLDMHPDAEAPGAKLSPDKWKTEFDALVASFPKRETRLDDSRDSIYRGRGE